LLNVAEEGGRTRIIRSGQARRVAVLFDNSTMKPEQFKKFALHIFLAPLCLALASGAAGAADAPAHLSWYGKPECRIAPVDAPPISEVRWNGACKDGYAEGRGVLSWRSPEGYRHELDGTLVRGAIQGVATLKWDNGGSYVGTFAGGRPHGQGYYRSAKGQYEGEVVNGKPEGAGIFLFPNGDRYEGQWKGGVREGQGRMRYVLGGAYDGEWRQDKRHGHGVLVYAGSGRRYEGEFVDDRVAGTPAPVVTKETYSLNRPDAYVGTNIKSKTVQGSAVPLDRGYAQLTPAQRQLVNAGFPALEEGDEPPYPLAGMQRFFTLVSNALGNYETEGTLYVHVLVGADGRAISVTSKGLEDQDEGGKMRYLVAVAAMSLEYKPALCRGKPCEMLFAFNLDMGLVL
jgi:hypothetical protein